MTLHAFLKQATATAHVDTEGGFVELGFGSVAGYTRFLRAQAGAVRAVEHALDPFQPEFEAAGLRWSRRSPALVRDLAVLGNTPPGPIALPPLAGFEAALGLAYVLEGSRIGNRILLRQVQETGDPAIQDATSFLGFPSESGYWQVFTQHLSQALPDEARWPEALGGALAGFDAFGRSAARESAGAAE